MESYESPAILTISDEEEDMLISTFCSGPCSLDGAPPCLFVWKR